MARASDVRPGQVWTAKVSGKDTKVQIVSELPPSKAGGRSRFEYKNLATGRTATGTAGKLRRLTSGATEAPATPAAAVTAPAAAAPASLAPRQRPRRHDPAPPLPSGDLESLRGKRPPPRHSREGPRPNPISYPSSLAQSAATAISQSGAQTVEQVVAAVQAWAGRSRSGGYGFSGAPAAAALPPFPYQPAQNYHNPYREYPSWGGW